MVACGTCLQSHVDIPTGTCLPMLVCACSWGMSRFHSPGRVAWINDAFNTLNNSLSFTLSIRSTKNDQIQENVNEARAKLENILKERGSTEVKLEVASVQASCSSCTFYVSFPGDQVSLRR